MEYTGHSKNLPQYTATAMSNADIGGRFYRYDVAVIKDINGNKQLLTWALLPALNGQPDNVVPQYINQNLSSALGGTMLQMYKEMYKGIDSLATGTVYRVHGCGTAFARPSSGRDLPLLTLRVDGSVPTEISVAPASSQWMGSYSPMRKASMRASIVMECLMKDASQGKSADLSPLSVEAAVAAVRSYPILKPAPSVFPSTAKYTPSAPTTTASTSKRKRRATSSSSSLSPQGHTSAKPKTALTHGRASPQTFTPTVPSSASTPSKVWMQCAGPNWENDFSYLKQDKQWKETEGKQWENINDAQWRDPRNYDQFAHMKRRAAALYQQYGEQYPPFGVEVKLYLS